MECLDENTLEALAWGSVAPDLRGPVEAHLDSCADCRRLLSWAIGNRPGSDGESTPPGPPTLAEETSLQDLEGPSVLHLPPGSLVDRYRLLKRLGVGGMGVVYLAHDPDLDRRVAIKLIRTGAAEPERKQRLLREAQAMARPQHPEVISVYDVGSALGGLFIAMEYVEGGTLRGWLAERPRGWREQLALFVRVGRGLAAAHAAGLVHRDFKPDNVLVGRDGRVRVTDFGLARLLHGPQEAAVGTGPSEAGDRVTQSGQFVGSLAYCAPEQMQGRPADPRADVYSFCVALYEALEGTRPFNGRDAADQLEQIRLGRVAPAVRPSGAPPWLQRAVLRGLAARPEDRWPSMEPLLAALSKDRRRPLRIAMLAVIALLVTTAAFRLGTRAALPPPGAPAEKLVAVLELENRSPAPESAWLSTAIGELVSAELHAEGGPRLVPSDEAARAQRELALVSSAQPSAESLRRLRRDVPVDYVVAGSFSSTGTGQLQLNLLLVEATTGRVLARADERGSTADLFDLAQHAGSLLRLGLRVPALGENDHRSTRASLPTRLEAARAYAQALLHFRAGDLVEAREVARSAVALEPEHALSHLLLARVLKGLGFQRDAIEEATRATETAASLEREQQLSIEFTARELASDWDRAVAVGRALTTFRPDRTDYALALAKVLNKAGRGKECSAVITALRSQPRVDAQDPAISAQAAGCAEAEGDSKRELEEAKQGLAQSEQRGARLLGLSNQLYVGRALRRLDQWEAATERLVQLRREAHALHAPFMESAALGELGAIAVGRWDGARAAPLLEEAVELSRSLGYRGGEAVALNNLAAIYFQSQPERARPLYQRALEIGEEVREEQASTLARSNLGLVDAVEGRVAVARSELAQAREQAHRMGDRALEAQCAFSLCGLLPRTGDLDAAARACDTTEQLWAEAGDSGGLPLLLAFRSALLLERRRPLDAERLAVKALESAKKSGVDLLIAQAGLSLTEARLGAHRTTAAREALASARGAAEKSGDHSMMAQATLDEARLALAGGRPDLASLAARLTAVTDQMLREGQVLIARECRLALHEIQLRAHTPDAGASLDALLAEARAAGDLLIVRRAEALRSRRASAAHPN